MARSRAAAAAKDPWPQFGSSEWGENQERENREQDAASPSSSNGTRNAVAVWFSSEAIFCLREEGKSPRGRRQTEAGLPLNAEGEMETKDH